MKHLNIFNVVVVGAGHAGVEAVNTCVNRGLSVALVSMDKGAIGRMSCNPAIGGVAKGQLVRELDILGGVMGFFADRSGLQHKLLNRSKGRSVWSPRAQIDKRLYESIVSKHILNLKNLVFVKGEAVSVCVKKNTVCGVELRDGSLIKSDTVIITCGTFLSGLIHVGDRKISAGRMGENNSIGISESLIKTGFKMMRLKTGTPPRVLKNSVVWNKTYEEFGDKNPVPFSLFTKNFNPKNKACHTVRTNESCHEIITKNLNRSPMYNGEISATGPRYCPSIEDKVNRFSKQPSHLLFLEPEWDNSDQIYLNGFSTSLPEEIQLKSLRKIPAFKNISFLRPGYAIEYDCIYPAQLKTTLESKTVSGLFFAGQINGTSGYEEASTQGLIAGVNAVSYIKNEEPLIVKRSEGYIGVMIDDLTTKDTKEPYRMFTSRAEYRLLLRYSNIDLRLFGLAKKHKLLSEDKINTIEERLSLREEINESINYSLSGEHIKTFGLKQGMPIKTHIKKQGVSLYTVLKKLNLLPPRKKQAPWAYNEVLEDIETSIKYEGYIKRHELEIKKLIKNEKITIGKDIDYSGFKGLSNEAKEKLNIVKPETFGQASRVSGVTPADLSALMIYLLPKK